MNMVQMIKEFLISIILLTISLFITASTFDTSEINTISYYSALLLIYLIYSQSLGKIIFTSSLEAQAHSITKHFIFIILLLLILKATASNFDETELNAIILFSILTALQATVFKKYIVTKPKGAHVP